VIHFIESRVWSLNCVRAAYVPYDCESEPRRQPKVWVQGATRLKNMLLALTVVLGLRGKDPLCF
jgi:hypothetical protein